MSKNSEIGENQADTISTGLDSILGSLEENGNLQQQLEAKIGIKKASIIYRIIQFGTVNKEGYELLRNEKTGYFRNLFFSLDTSFAEQDLGIQLDDDAKKGFGGVFEIQVIQLLVNHEIFGYILTHKFGEKYNLIYTFSGGNIYQDSESGVFFLNIGEEFYPESNIVQKHYDIQNSYLYFDGGDIFFIFDVQKNHLIEFDGEFDNVREVGEKHYMLFHSPNEENALKSSFYCIEDTSEVEKNISGNAGYYLEIFDYLGETFTLASDHYKYRGYAQGKEYIKYGNTVKIQRYGQKLCFIEQEGIFKNIKFYGKYLCLISERREYYEENGKGKNSSKELINFYDKNGDIIQELGIEIPTHRIIKKIETPHDTLYIVHIDENKIDIFSLGNNVVLSHIWGIYASKIDSIESEDGGSVIHFSYSNGKKGFFPSADYPSLHSH